MQAIPERIEVTISIGLNPYVGSEFNLNKS